MRNIRFTPICLFPDLSIEKAWKQYHFISNVHTLSPDLDFQGTELLEEMSDCVGQDQGKYKMSLEYFIMPENKQVLKNDGKMSKEHKSLEGPSTG